MEPDIRYQHVLAAKPVASVKAIVTGQISVAFDRALNVDPKESLTRMFRCFGRVGFTRPFHETMVRSYVRKHPYLQGYSETAFQNAFGQEPRQH